MRSIVYWFDFFMAVLAILSNNLESFIMIFSFVAYSSVSKDVIQNPLMLSSIMSVKEAKLLKAIGTHPLLMDSNKTNGKPSNREVISKMEDVS